MVKKSQNTNALSAILRGEFIADKNNVKYSPYILFIVSLILFNISISFRAESLLKKSIYIEKEVADLRLVYITTKSELTSMYRRSVVENLVDDLEIQTSLTPPKIVEY
tara:strand:+ start:26 stop:349 length:324 start_codon:yes stop_codon:yes gene_type:complete